MTTNKDDAAAQVDVECKWSTCTARFESTDQLLPHISTLHLTANHMGRIATVPTTMSGGATAAGASNNQPFPQQQMQSETFQSTEAFQSITEINRTMATSLAQSVSLLSCKWSACGTSTFPTIDDLIQHVSMQHIPMPLDQRLRPHRCRWSQCGNTDQQFTTFDDLTTHISSFHVGSGKHMYICEWTNCDRRGKPFTQRPKLMRHVQTHTGDKPYVCTVCWQRLAEGVSMAQHLRTHTGEKPYACPETSCQKQFTLSSALTVHLRLHTGDKPFPCQVSGCTKRFADHSNLRKHVRVHTGEKPFRCPIGECEKVFARSDQVARHTRIHQRMSSR